MNILEQKLNCSNFKYKEAFGLIANKFFNKNFGLCSKSEFELLMFHILINNLDESDITDYKLSKILGITQQRVRNLRIKKNLTYPKETNLSEKLEELSKTARFIGDNKEFIVINIEDPNLFIELQNEIEINFSGFVDIQLNKKIFKIKTEYFIELLISKNKKYAEKYKRLYKDQKKYIVDDITIVENIKNRLKDNMDIISIASIVAGII